MRGDRDDAIFGAGKIGKDLIATVRGLGRDFYARHPNLKFE